MTSKIDFDINEIKKIINEDDFDFTDTFCDDDDITKDLLLVMSNWKNKMLFSLFNSVDYEHMTYNHLIPLDALKHLARIDPPLEWLDGESIGCYESTREIACKIYAQKLVHHKNAKPKELLYLYNVIKGKDFLPIDDDEKKQLLSEIKNHHNFIQT